MDDAEGPPLVGDALRGGAVCLLRARVDAVGLGGGHRVDVRDAGAEARDVGVHARVCEPQSGANGRRETRHPRQGEEALPGQLGRCECNHHERFG